MRDQGKPTHAFHPLPVPETTPARSADDEDYVQRLVYDPESSCRIPHTQSMGAPQVSDSDQTEPVSGVTPPATPPKPKSCHHRKPKQIVVKEKVYKIR